MKTLTICGSVAFLQEMQELKTQLESLGFEVYMPEVNYHLENGNENGKTKIIHNVIQRHYDKIMISHAIVVLNREKKGIKGYIGGNTLMELGYAFVNKREIFLLNPIPEMSYTDEIVGMQPVIINQLEEINEYFDSLPKVYLASESPIKLRAADFAFRSVGKKVNVKGYKTNSKVSDQPIGFEETYEGAKNRLEDLKKQVTGEYEYLVSVESGNIHLTNDCGLFGFSVCIIEDKKGNKKIGMETSFAIPKEMMDLIPSEYPDLGVLVQQKYGFKEKDPMAYISNGNIKRDVLIQFAVKSSISQF